MNTIISIALLIASLAVFSLAQAEISNENSPNSLPVSPSGRQSNNMNRPGQQQNSFGQKFAQQSQQNPSGQQQPQRLSENDDQKKQNPLAQLVQQLKEQIRMMIEEFQKRFPNRRSQNRDSTPYDRDTTTPGPVRPTGRPTDQSSQEDTTEFMSFAS